VSETAQNSGGHSRKEVRGDPAILYIIYRQLFVGPTPLPRKEKSLALLLLSPRKGNNIECLSLKQSLDEISRPRQIPGLGTNQ
jgi:hypothetical protein